MIAAKSYPIARPLPHALFILRSPAALKSIPGIAGEPAGKIPPVVGIPLPFHGNLFAVVELRDTTDAQRERDVQHCALQAGAFQRHESRSVVEGASLEGAMLHIAF